MSEKVSIVVPVFNVERYLKRCLDSILAQTYGDIEVIVVNDGSTDGSADVLATYSGEKRVRILSQPNGGLSVARNSGLAVAEGSWLMFVDSDDAIHPELVSVAMKLARERDADFIRYEERNVPAESMDKFDDILSPPRFAFFDDPVKYYIEKQLKASACVSLYRASTLRDMRFTPGLIYEDLDFTWRYLRRAKSGVHLGWAPYNYVQSAGSITRSGFDGERLSSIDFIIRNIEKTYGDAGDGRLRLIKKRLFPVTVKKQILKPFLRLPHAEKESMSEGVAKTVAGLMRDGLIGLSDFSLRWWPLLATMRIKAKG